MKFERLHDGRRAPHQDGEKLKALALFSRPRLVELAERDSQQAGIGVDDAYNLVRADVKKEFGEDLYTWESFGEDLFWLTK